MSNESEKIVLNKPVSQSTGSVISVDELFKRAPASVNVPTELSLSTQFFCKDEKNALVKPTQKVKKNMVMLRFKICLDEKQIQSVTLFNETNGFRAQIFKHNLGQYKTDYIQLNDGSNKVSAEVVLKDGQKSLDSLVILTGS